MNKVHIARLCHEANGAYCAAIGDASQVSWDDAPEWQRDSCLSGVAFVLDHPLAPPSSNHNNWLADNQILDNANLLSNIPGWLIHGWLDLSGPVDAPWKLHQLWPGSTLIVVDDEGHGGLQMVAHWSRILQDLAKK